MKRQTKISDYELVEDDLNKYIQILQMIMVKKKDYRPGFLLASEAGKYIENDQLVTGRYDCLEDCVAHCHPNSEKDEFINRRLSDWFGPNEVLIKTKSGFNDYYIRSHLQRKLICFYGLKSKGGAVLKRGNKEVIATTQAVISKDYVRCFGKSPNENSKDKEVKILDFGTLAQFLTNVLINSHDLKIVKIDYHHKQENKEWILGWYSSNEKPNEPYELYYKSSNYAYQNEIRIIPENQTSAGSVRNEEKCWYPLAEKPQDMKILIADSKLSGIDKDLQMKLSNIQMIKEEFFKDKYPIAWDYVSH
jgi:hypothetical protein